MDATVGDLLSEWYSDHYATIQGIESAIDEGGLGYEALTALQKQRNAIRELLGLEPTVYTGDDVLDYYETEIAAGREPPMDVPSREIRRLIQVRDRAAAKKRQRELVNG